MRCKHNSPQPQLGSGRHLVCLSITRSAKESSCVSSRNVKCLPQLPWQPVELLHSETSGTLKCTQNTAGDGGSSSPKYLRWAIRVASGHRWQSCSLGLQLSRMQGRAAPSMENPSMAQAQRAAHCEPPEKVPQSLPRQSDSGNLQPTAELLNIRAGTHQAVSTSSPQSSHSGEGQGTALPEWAMSSRHWLNPHLNPATPPREEHPSLWKREILEQLLPSKHSASGRGSGLQAHPGLSAKPGGCAP